MKLEKIIGSLVFVGLVLFTVNPIFAGVVTEKYLVMVEKHFVNAELIEVARSTKAVSYETPSVYTDPSVYHKRARQKILYFEKPMSIEPVGPLGQQDDVLSSGPSALHRAVDYLHNIGLTVKFAQNGSSNINTWRIINDSTFQGSLAPSFRFSNYFDLDGGLEMILAKDISLTHLTLGPKLMFGKSNRFIPYFKACAIYGQLDWSGPPGDFQNDIGWQAAIGADFLDGPFKLGLHFTYQDIKFDYNAPAEQQVESHQDSIDFSGYKISAILKYHF
jgi:hypothetical protein